MATTKKKKKQRYPGGKVGRVFSKNGLAIRHALNSDLDDMKRVALRHVHAAIIKHNAAASLVAKEIGVARSTYQVWVDSIPEVRELHYRYRPANTPGRVPRSLLQYEEAAADDED